MYSDFVLDILERLDRYFAWKITLRFLFRPMYGDYSFTGRILGFFLRIIRIAVGGIIYAVIFLIAIILYLIWIALPPYIIFKSLSFFNV